MEFMRMQPRVIRVGYFILVFLVIVLIIVSAFKLFSGDLLQRSSTLSPNILAITQPVYSITGTVDSVEANTVTLTVRTVPLTPGGQNKNTQQNQNPVVYRVVVGDSTVITKPFAPVIPLEGGGAPQTFKTTDIKPGMLVTVASQNDLRLVSGSTFTAQTVTLPPDVKSVSGVITAISGASITVKGMPLDPAVGLFTTPSPPKEFVIETTDKTKILQTGTSVPSKQTEMNFSDLKTGIPVTVTVDTDITSSGTHQATVIVVNSVEITSVPTFTPSSSPAAVVSGP